MKYFFIIFFMCVAVPAFALSVIPGKNENLYGMNTTAGGGRHLGESNNATVYKVTNLNNSGSGSLRDALENQNSIKTIIFEVSGNIELQSGIKIGGFTGNDAETKGSYITIAGQTAPSPGITIKNYGITIERNCHDILMQHIRIRPGDTSLIALGCPSCAKADIADPLTLVASYGGNWVPPYNIVVDHCSFSWGGDMNVQTGADDITFSNNIISEALHSPLHPKGPHSKGLYVIAYTPQGYGGVNNAIINNLLAHNYDRNPKANHGEMLIANNLIYDFWSAMNVGDNDDNSGDMLASIVGNYLIETSITWIGEGGFSLVCGNDLGTRYYVSPHQPYDDAEPNYFHGSIQIDPWCVSGGGPDCMNHSLDWTDPDTDCPVWSWATSPPMWPVGYAAMSAVDARTYVLANAGARPADRDSVDIRIVSETTAGSFTSAIIASQSDVGGWPNLAENTRSLTVPSNPNEVQASGYTKLEEWLHGYLGGVEDESSDDSGSKMSGTTSSGCTF